MECDSIISDTTLNCFPTSAMAAATVREMVVATIDITLISYLIH